MKRLSVVLGFIVFLIALLLIFNETKNSVNIHEKKFYHMQTFIVVKTYQNVSEDVLNKVDSIYKKYSELTDLENGYPGLNNLYYLRTNDKEDEYLDIKEELYDMISYGLKWEGELYSLSKKDINDYYKQNDTLISDIKKEQVVLKDGKILNNHAAIDLSDFRLGYATLKAKEYLESKGIKKYIINAGGVVVVGKPYDKNSYLVGIEDPTLGASSIFKTLKLKNKASISIGTKDSNMTFDNKDVLSVISADGVPSKYQGITVICDNPLDGDMIAHIAALMDEEDALKFFKEKNVEGLLYVSSEEQLLTAGFNKYFYDKK